MKSSTLQAEPISTLGSNLTFGLFDRLGRRIVAGHYDQEPFPTEMDLVRQYRVSHGVIREAVKMLAAKGLVSVRTGRGTLVAPEELWNLLDADILRWLMERGSSPCLIARFNDLRAAIEPEAAALAASAAKADDHARIECGVNRIAAAIQGRDSAAEAGVAFHLAVFEAAHNPFYARFHKLVATAFRASIHLQGLNKSVVDHASVLEAILIGDPDRARRGMRAIVNVAITNFAPTIDWQHENGSPAPAKSGPLVPSGCK